MVTLKIFKNYRKRMLHSLVNNSSPMNFFYNNEIWLLGRFDFKKQMNICDKWIIYTLNNKKINIRQIEISKDISLGSINALCYDKTNYVYVFTGPVFSFVDERQIKSDSLLYRYNIRKNEWDFLSSFPLNFSVENIFFDDIRNNLIIFGLLSNRKIIYEYSLKKNTYYEYELILPENSIRGYSIVYNGTALFMYGGFDSNDVCYNKMYKINTANYKTINEIKVSKMAGRTFAFSIYIKKYNSILFYGGTPNGYDFTNTGYIYNIEENCWYKIPELTLESFNKITTCCFDYENNILFFLGSYKYICERKEYLYENKDILSIDVERILEKYRGNKKSKG